MPLKHCSFVNCHSRLQGMLSKAKLKNTLSCSWLHMHTVLMVVSIVSETESEKYNEFLFSVVTFVLYAFQRPLAFQTSISIVILLVVSTGIGME